MIRVKSNVRDRELASEILRHMLQRWSDVGYTTPRWSSTSALRMALNKDVREQATMRRVLDKLYDLRKVKRAGSGKASWCLNIKKFDPYSVFSPPSEDDMIDPTFKTSSGGATVSSSYAPTYTPVNRDEEEDAEIDEDTDEEKSQQGLTDEEKRMIKEMTKEINILTNSVVSLQKENTELSKKYNTLKDTIDRTRTIEIKKPDGKVIKLKNKVLPAVYDHVLDLAKMRKNILLVGPAGCGKTYLGELVAKSLGLDFGSLSCTAGMSENHLLGRGVPNITKGNNVFQGTRFLELYEDGGLFLLDELDSADPNLLLSINSAIANRYCNVPNRPSESRAEQHPDFVLIATANTFGRGATRVYAGRNQLDEATLDRFRIGTVECDYDPIVEASVCPDDELRNYLTGIRAKVAETGLRRVISTRFLIDAYQMKTGVNWDMSKIKKVLYLGWGKDEIRKVDYEYASTV